MALSKDAHLSIPSLFKLITYALILILGAIIGYHARDPHQTVRSITNSGLFPSSRHGGAINTAEAWTKPKNVKIIGMVFYGRRQTVDILDCYMRQNLAVNGGYLDEVNFYVNTVDQADLRYLDKLLQTSPQYKKVTVEAVSRQSGYIDFWRHASQDKSSLYVKIDDDITYIHQDAIPRLVHSLIDHPTAYAVAANLINSPVTNWLHWHTGAIHPYLPDTAPSNGRAGASAKSDPKSFTWKPSQLPPYRGHIDEPFDFSKPVPHEGHRWLPVAGSTAEVLAKTPNAFAAYETSGPCWNQWQCAAQQHYSLFENLERGSMDLYWGGGSGNTGNVTWNMWYQRYNINLMAIWGETIGLREFMFDDEVAMSVMVPMELKRPLLIQMSSVASHYSFSTQRDVASTDVLSRYRSYANDMVCSADNQKKPLT